MRQAGRHLPEYRAIREEHSFQEVVATPELAAEVTLQPVRRYGMDGAVIFADIMTPLEAMGVPLVFDPGPQLEPLTLQDVVSLPALDPGRVANVSETIRMVKDEVPAGCAVIGFAGAPLTLLAYLLEGGGSKEFMKMRAALRSEPELAAEALRVLGSAMADYLTTQIEAGADVVQLFDTWSGLLDAETYERFVVPSAGMSLADVTAPTIYFAPGAGHLLDPQLAIGASGYGVDWRVPLGEALSKFEGRAVQGNLDPSVLHSDPATIELAVQKMLDQAVDRPGYIVNLGHGIDRLTPPENVAAFVEAVRS